MPAVPTSEPRIPVSPPAIALALQGGGSHGAVSKNSTSWSFLSEPHDAGYRTAEA